jgi:hypothetical protein
MNDDPLQGGAHPELFKLKESKYQPSATTANPIASSS